MFIKAGLKPAFILVRLTGLEPVTFGSVDLHVKIVTIVKTVSYNKSN
jgi:hypothetical protein